ncbi:MAG: hypothetical protein Q4P34_00225 [Tissierellia bacterium]|nr:hypothetical protein [Tissierellia bacterium]
MESKKIEKYTTGSLLGYLILVGVGLLLYFLLTPINNSGALLQPYGVLIGDLQKDSFIAKIIWMIKDFSEGQFYGGLFAGLGLILGGCVAWFLDVKRSKLRGFSITYGLNIWPWILLSQILALSFSVFALKYLNLIDGVNFSWLPTFLLLVGAPQAVLCVFGPSISALITGVLLASFLSLPIANFVGNYIMVPIGMPQTIANYIALALSITLTLQVCKLAPWIKKTAHPVIRENHVELTEEQKYDLLKSPLYLIRRSLADFTDCYFYGNEWPSLFLIIGALIDWLINFEHGMGGAGVFPAILLSQLVSGGLGVFLYGRKHLEYGWYPTYVPVVSIGPFCVLTFGTGLHVVFFAGILGGIIGAPFAELLNRNLPDDMHGVIPNVLAMAITTMTVISVMRALPWFV